MNKPELIKLVEDYNAESQGEQHHKNMVLDFLKSTEDYLGRTNTKGHITASSWIVNRTKDRTLLTHHEKMNRWP